MYNAELYLNLRLEIYSEKSSKDKFRSWNSELGSLNGISDSWFPLEISLLHPRRVVSLGLSTLALAPSAEYGATFSTGAQWARAYRFVAAGERPMIISIES